MRRRDLRERPETEPAPRADLREGTGSEPDMGALDDVKDSTGSLTANIESFAEGTMALHEATVSKLQNMAGKLSDLESRVLSHY